MNAKISEAIMYLLLYNLDDCQVQENFWQLKAL